MSVVRTYAVTIGERERTIRVRRLGDGVTPRCTRYEVSIDGGSVAVIDGARPMPDTLSLLMNGRSWEVGLVDDDDGFEVDIFGVRHQAAVVDPRRKALRMADGVGELVIRTQMPGRVVRVLVAVGDVLEKGQTAVVVEAMKMENELKAAQAGTVQRILVSEGEQIEAKTILIELLSEAS